MAECCAQTLDAALHVIAQSRMSTPMAITGPGEQSCVGLASTWQPWHGIVTRALLCGLCLSGARYCGEPLDIWVVRYAWGPRYQWHGLGEVSQCSTAEALNATSAIWFYHGAISNFTFDPLWDAFEAFPQVLLLEVEGCGHLFRLPAMLRYWCVCVWGGGGALCCPPLLGGHGHPPAHILCWTSSRAALCDAESAAGRAAVAKPLPGIRGHHWQPIHRLDWCVVVLDGPSVHGA
jgi:hypothetical protein